jgi:uncharacterized protein (DUF427 family)
VRPPQPDSVGPGPESGWDYPRPPSAEVAGRRIETSLGGEVITGTDLLGRRRRRDPALLVAWSYEQPTAGYEQLRGALALSPPTSAAAGDPYPLGVWSTA